MVEFAADSSGGAVRSSEREQDREVEPRVYQAVLLATFTYRFDARTPSLICPVSIFIAFCCACANGYDGSLMTAILAMPYFQQVFKTGTTGGQVSLVFSLYTV